MIDREDKIEDLEGGGCYVPQGFASRRNERETKERGGYGIMDSGSRYLSRSIRVEAARELGLGNWAGLDQNEARVPLGWQAQVYY